MHIPGVQPSFPMRHIGSTPQAGPPISSDTKAVLKALGMADGVLSKDQLTAPLKQMGEGLQSLRVMTPRPDQAHVLSLLGIPDAVLVMALHTQAVEYLNKKKLKLASQTEEDLASLFGLSEEEMMMVSDASGGIHLIRRSMDQLQEEIA